MKLILIVKGFLTGIALILPVGPQNVFILKQGLQRNYRFVTASTCAIIDCILFYLGINGVGGYIAESKALMLVALYGGSAFLLYFAFGCFRRVLSSFRQTHIQTEAIKPNLKETLLILLGVTLLNPHVYLDSLVFIGALGSQYGDARMSFAYGAMLGSLFWFFALAFGSTQLAPLFNSKKAWIILDLINGILMLWLVYTLWV